MTGASSGIGEAVALDACSQGATVVLAARRRERLTAIAAACTTRGGTPSILSYDAADGNAGVALAAHVRHVHGGRLDLLVLNAGIAGPWARFDTLNGTHAMERVLAVNYFGYVRALQAALPLLAPGARVVAVSSFYGRIPAPFQAGYAAAKHALHGFFNTVRPELAARGISVTVHCPGGIATEVQSKFETVSAERATLDMPDVFLASAEDCAASILHAAEARVAEAYFPMYAALAVEARQMFPGPFDAGFTAVVARYMDTDVFSLTPASEANQSPA